MFNGSTAARAIKPTPNDEVLTEFKNKPSPWCQYDGIRMSMASANFIEKMKKDVEDMQEQRLGS